MQWNDEMKAAVERKETVRKEVLGARDEDVKDRCMEAYREEKRKVKRCIYLNKKEVNEQFGRKMNQNVYGKRQVRQMEDRWRVAV